MCSCYRLCKVRSWLRVLSRRAAATANATAAAARLLRHSQPGVLMIAWQRPLTLSLAANQFRR